MAEEVRDYAFPNASTQHDRPLPDATLDPTSVNNEKSTPYLESSNASTQLQPASFSVDIVDEKALPREPYGQERTVTGIKWALVVLSILSSTFLYALDNTVVADVEANIVDTFGEIQKLAWLPIAFLVSCVATNSLW